MRLRAEIRHLQHKLGVTTVRVTHDQEEALSVADFVGKINVLPGRLQPGRSVPIVQMHFVCELEADAARDVKVYLRPEDLLARPIAPGDPNVFQADIEKIEFLGSYCHVSVRSAEIGPQSLTVYLSLNYLTEQGLAVGSRLPLRVMPERMRFF